jgi:hypothetical protein
MPIADMLIAGVILRQLLSFINRLTSLVLTLPLNLLHLAVSSAQ